MADLETALEKEKEKWEHHTVEETKKARQTEEETAAHEETIRAAKAQREAELESQVFGLRMGLDGASLALKAHTVVRAWLWRNVRRVRLLGLVRGWSIRATSQAHTQRRGRNVLSRLFQEKKEYRRERFLLVVSVWKSGALGNRLEGTLKRVMEGFWRYQETRSRARGFSIWLQCLFEVKEERLRSEAKDSVKAGSKRLQRGISRILLKIKGQLSYDMARRAVWTWGGKARVHSGKKVTLAGSMVSRLIVARTWAVSARFRRLLHVWQRHMLQSRHCTIGELTSKLIKAAWLTQERVAMARGLRVMAVQVQARRILKNRQQNSLVRSWATQHLSAARVTAHLHRWRHKWLKGKSREGSEQTRARFCLLWIRTITRTMRTYIQSRCVATWRTLMHEHTLTVPVDHFVQTYQKVLSTRLLWQGLCAWIMLHSHAKVSSTPPTCSPVLLFCGGAALRQ